MSEVSRTPEALERAVLVLFDEMLTFLMDSNHATPEERTQLKLALHEDYRSEDVQRWLQQVLGGILNVADHNALCLIQEILYGECDQEVFVAEEDEE